MRDEDERDPELGLERLELDLEILAQPRIECAERLVEEQDLGRQDERARESDPLLLTTGELARLALAVVGELDEVERLRDALPVLVLRQLLVLETEADVVRDVQVREERVALEDGVDLALVRRYLSHVDVVEHDSTARRALEPRDHAQRRRLPAAGWADHREELAAGHPQVDPVDRGHVTELLRQLLEMNLSLHQTSTPTAAAASSPPANFL